MIIVRLLHWVFRVPCLPAVDSTGAYVPGKQRPPTLGEAITGVSGT